MTYSVWEKDLKRCCIDDDYSATETEKILDYYARFYETRLDMGEKPSEIVEKLGNPRVAAERVKHMMDGDVQPTQKAHENRSAVTPNATVGTIEKEKTPKRRGCIYGFFHLIFGVVLIIPITAVFFLLSLIVSVVNLVFPIAGFAAFILSFFTPLTMLFGVNWWGWLCLMGIVLVASGLMLVISYITTKFATSIRAVPKRVFRAYFGLNKQKEEK